MNPCSVLIPVETAVRELDAKLLLAAVAAERGFPVVLGSRTYMHYALHALPRGVYLAKSMRRPSRVVFRIARELGHDIVAFDEEGLVRPPEPHYVARRLDARAMRRVSRLLAWGEDDASVFARYAPARGVPVHATGNCRGDLLRADLRRYFDPDVEALRKEHGDFVLVASSFAAVQRLAEAGSDAPTGEYWHARARHRAELLARFEALVPALARDLPGTRIVVRPHPAESRAHWEEIAARTPGVVVDGARSVVPWALAARAVVHNGSSAGLEAALLGAHVVTYQPVANGELDAALPNALSECASTPREVADAIARGPKVSAIDRALVERHVAALEGPLASDRIVDVLVAAGYLAGPTRARNPLLAAKGAINSVGRRVLKQRDRARDGHARSDAHHAHRFPEVDAAELQARVERFARTLGRFGGVRVAARSPHLFDVVDERASARVRSGA